MISQRRLGSLLPGRSQEPGTLYLQIEAGTLQVGDTIHIDGLGFNVEDTVEALILHGEPVEQATAGDVVEVHLTHRVYHDAQVYLVAQQADETFQDVRQRFGHTGRIPPAPRVSEPSEETAEKDQWDHIETW